MTNVLITGIDGFVGNHLARCLLTQPDVRIFGIVRDRNYSAAINDIRDRLRVHEADINDRDKTAAAIGECRPDRIFHLAGQAYVPEAVKNPLETFQTNILGSLHVLEAVRAEFPKCSILVISSGEVYGIVDPARMPVDESFPINPHTPYSASKACLDLLAQQYRTIFGLNAVIARAFNHLGPGQSEMFAGSSFAKQIVEAKLGLREKKIFVGNLDNRRDFTDVRDVVRAYVGLLDRKYEHGIFNVCSGRAVAMKDLLATLIRISGVPMEVVSDPHRFRAVDNPLMIGSAARLKAATGWIPSIPLEQTLADILEYWEKRLAK